MNTSPSLLNRREFTKTALAAGAAVAAGAASAFAAEPAKRIRTGVIGCGSVSGSYLPVLTKSPFVEVVSLCDIKPERARKQAEKFKIANHYPNIDAMLAGEPFEFLVNLTDMQEHEHLNRQALTAGKHVWSEKPIANTLAAGQELLKLAKAKQRRLWGAPITVQSPQFAFMARQLAQGALGRVAAAHADYGHEGPNWSSFFYEKGGGSMPDLGVYNITTLTGLLGPAKSVTAMLSIVKPERTIDEKGKIKVEAEDNAHILMEHDKNVLSHVMCGFNFFDPHGHEAGTQSLHSIQIYGDSGNMRLIGYDWETNGVVLDTSITDPPKLLSTEKGGYEWQEGATKIGEALVKGIEPRINAEHALHVLEIIEAARKSQATGTRIKLKSKFPWPMV